MEGRFAERLREVVPRDPESMLKLGYIAASGSRHIGQWFSGDAIPAGKTIKKIGERFGLGQAEIENLKGLAHGDRVERLREAHGLLRH